MERNKGFSKFLHNGMAKIFSSLPVIIIIIYFISLFFPPGFTYRSFITNKLYPLSIVINGPEVFDEIKVYRKSLAGKGFEFEKSETNNEWIAEKSAVKEIYMVLPENILKQIREVNITIGKENFIFTAVEIRQEWSSKKKMSSIILEVPFEVSSKRSSLPVFKGLINWPGGMVILKDYCVGLFNIAVKLFLLFLIAFILIFLNQKICKLSLEFILIILLTTALLASVLFLSINNLSNPNFWFDEGASFWIAKGLTPFSAPLSKERGIIDVVIQNRYYNMDPGVYSLLLHCWIKISNAPLWLRLSPFIFYLITILSFILVMRNFSNSWKVILISTLFLFLSNMLMHYSFELRAYSMEVAGIMLSILFLQKIIKAPNKKNLFILGLICAIFMGSRYSFVINIAAIGICLYFLVFKSFKKYFFYGYYFYLPVVISFFLIYVFTLRYQNPSADPQLYVVPMLLKDKGFSEILDMVKLNFLSKEAFATTLFLLLFSYIKFIYKDIERFRDDSFYCIYIWIIFYQIISIILSFLGKHPWCITGRWAIGLQCLSIITNAILFTWIYLYFKDNMKIKNFLRDKKFLYSFLFAFFTIIVFTISYNFHYGANDSVYDNLTAFKKTDLERCHFFIPKETSGTVRYLFEYGPLKSFKNYPHNFIFETDHMEKTIDAEKININTLIFSHSRPEAYLPGIKGDFVEVTHKLPSRIFLERNFLESLNL